MFLKYTEKKEKIVQLNNSLSDLLSSISVIVGDNDSSIKAWKGICGEILEQLREEKLRVAVVGPVKSGKSTLVNSIFRGDYVKRGAGIVTSTVTRIRTGHELRAKLVLKTWDEINAEIHQSLLMLPTWDPVKPFDIRNSGHRMLLEESINNLDEGLVLQEDGRNPALAKTSLYLTGYEEMKDLVSAGVIELRGDEFYEHQRFVKQDSLALYIKDIELTINSDELDPSVEIADCQGSDSPNPVHLALLQEYLTKSNFIIYVISSRIGLREADVKFLNIIRKMGLLHNMIFVINIDLSEHESIEDLKSVLNKIRVDLSMIKPEPEIFAFSALFNLFRSDRVDLSKKDSMRLQQWMTETDMVNFSNSESNRFEQMLKETLIKQRFSLIINNHLERMQVIADGIKNWINTTKEALKRDSEGTSELITRVKHHYQRMEQIKYLIRNTLHGTKENIMQEIKRKTDNFFSTHSEGLTGQMLGFIDDYSTNISKYRTRLITSGFSGTLYSLFQDFKSSLDEFIAENIDPEIVRFSREIEDMIKEEFIILKISQNLHIM